LRWTINFGKLVCGLTKSDALLRIIRNFKEGMYAGAAIAALVAFQALWSRSYPCARIAAAAPVGLILIGWGLAQYPYLVRPELTIFNSASPPNILVDLEIAVALGAVILIPSLVLLLLIFKRDGKSISASVDKTVSEAFTRGELL
jgi:cytochrome bd-type quinol oxidase subunit 2